MERNEIERKWALIAAISFLSIVLFYLLEDIIICYQIYGHFAVTLLDYPGNVFYFGILLVLSVALFLRNKTVLLIGAGAMVAYGVYWLIDYFAFYYFCDILGYLVLVILVILSIKKNEIVTKIWFIPSVLYIVGTCIEWIRYGYFSNLEGVWASMVLTLAEIAGLFFTGMWLSETMAPATNSLNGYSPFNTNVDSAMPADDSELIGGADRIRMYKELLDSGIITQEEFEQKKKQILGL